MQFYDALYRIAAENGLTFDKLSLKMGHTSSYISAPKSRGSVPKVSNAVKMVAECGYVICAIPKDKVPDNAIEIDGPETE